MSKQITVIGDGAMGTLCGVMLAENGHAVRLWSAFEDQARDIESQRENRKFLPGCALPENLHATADDATAFEGAELIFSAVPTQYLRKVWQTLAPHCPGDVPICSITKGIEEETLLRPSQMVLDALGESRASVGGARGRPLAALSGPSIAPEIAEHLPATVAVAAEPPALADEIQELISRPYFRVYTNPDMLGVELAGATKNVIAIAAGVLDGLDLGDNAKAALVSRGLVEIARLGQAAGAQAETFYGLAGVGDLITTCISPVGRNRSFGERIGKGQSAEEALNATESVVEGVRTTRSVLALAERLDVEMPLCQGVYDVIFEGRDPRQAIDDLMARPFKSEQEQ
jgi:glycerol-3-phosphate dehydrogenase (NAD(P)+)